MAEVRAAWNETGDKLTELGRKLKVHYDEQHGGDGQRTREELADAARKVGAAVQDAFEAIGSAARDKSVQDDVKQVGRCLTDALGATLGQASEELKRAFSERKGCCEPEASATIKPIEGGPAKEEPAGGDKPADGESGTGPKVEPWGTP
jgi:hypothetical protein